MVRSSDWQVSPDGHLGTVLRDCLLSAVAAPSVHNTQPWRFRPRADGVDVLADRSRGLSVIDASGRELLISVGAALFNLRVAIAAHGRTPIVNPPAEGDEVDLVARVHFGQTSPPSGSARLLAHAIPLRHTNRRGFSTTPVPGEVLNDLAEAASVEGANLVLADARTRETVLCLVRLAERLEVSDEAYRTELSAWTRPWWRRHDGVPPQAYGPWNALETVPVRDFGLVKPAQRRRVENFEEEPTIAVLFSPGDTVADWVMTGQALERVLLTATTRGVATTLMTQPMEVPHLRELMTDAALGRVPQVIVRFGYGLPSGTSPRRPIDEVVELTHASRRNPHIVR